MSGTPTVVLDALVPKEESVAGREFVPVVAAHILALEASGNSHLDERKDITYLDTLRAAALLTRSGAEARKLAGNPAALTAAAEAIGDDLAPAELRGLVVVIMRRIAESMSTGLRVKSEGGDAGESPAADSAGS